MYNSISLNGTAATFAEAIGVPAPNQSNPPLEPILQMIENGCGQKHVRLFMGL